MQDPFMTSEPIPKTMPRSTLACPPAKNFTDSLRNTSNPVSSSIKPGSSQVKEDEDKKIRRNDSENKGFGMKGSQNIQKPDNFASSGTNFRASSKDNKGQQSTKNLGTKNFETLSKNK